MSMVWRDVEQELIEALAQDITAAIDNAILADLRTQAIFYEVLYKLAPVNLREIISLGIIRT